MIGDAAVAKESPKLLAKGGIIGGAIVLAGGGLIWAGKKGYNYLKDRKAKIESEPALKEEFDKMIDAELAKDETEQGLIKKQLKNNQRLIDELVGRKVKEKKKKPPIPPVYQGEEIEVEYIKDSIKNPYRGGGFSP